MPSPLKRQTTAILTLGVTLAIGGVAVSSAVAQSSAPDWELPLTPIYTSMPGSTSGPVITDVNGDGLIDFVFSWNTQSTSGTDWTQWVRLNNGRGWDTVYTCNRHASQNQWTGDCAYRNN